MNNCSRRTAGRRRRRQEPLTLGVVRRYKYANKRRDQPAAISLDKTGIEIDHESITDIEDFQKAQQAQLQRAMYNARQTPFIPLITDIDYSVVLQSSQQQNDLFINVLNLINNIDKECSFFEQFKI